MWVLVRTEALGQRVLGGQLGGCRAQRVLLEATQKQRRHSTRRLRH